MSSLQNLNGVLSCMCMGVNQRNLKLLHMAEVPSHQIVGHLPDFLKIKNKFKITIIINSGMITLLCRLQYLARVDLTLKIVRKLRSRGFFQYCAHSCNFAKKFLVKSARSFLDFCHLTIFFYVIIFRTYRRLSKETEVANFGIIERITQKLIESN